MEGNSTESYHMVGYSAFDAREIVRSVRDSDTSWVTGDYTAWSVNLISGHIEWAVSGPIASNPVYYAFSRDGTPFLGTDIFSLARAAGLCWDWNLRAIQCMGLLGHTLGRDTLHPKIWRAPNDTLMRFSVGSVREWPLGFWTDAPSESDIFGTLDLARRTLQRDTGSGGVLLSLSAGYDSRLLLGMCLAEGMKPRCVTVGAEDSTDVLIASELARSYGLNHQTVALRPRDYLTHGQEISRLTSGTKTASNWPTYLYSKAVQSGDPDEKHIVGTNAEFARSLYLDHAPEFLPRWLSRLVSSQGPSLASHLPSSFAQAYWFSRFEKRILGFKGLDLISKLGMRDVLRIVGMTRNGAPDMASALDQFYSCQRVWHFNGNGIALYTANGLPRSPFLDGTVVRSIWGLPREAKAGNRFHLESMRKLDASLLDFPFNLSRTGSRQTHDIFPIVRTLPAATDAILDCPDLDVLISKHEREEVVRSGPTCSFELLLTLAFAARNS